MIDLYRYDRITYMSTYGPRGTEGEKGYGRGELHSPRRSELGFGGPASVGGAFSEMPTAGPQMHRGNPKGLAGGSGIPQYNQSLLNNLKSVCQGVERLMAPKHGPAGPAAFTEGNSGENDGAPTQSSPSIDPNLPQPTREERELAERLIKSIENLVGGEEGRANTLLARILGTSSYLLGEDTFSMASSGKNDYDYLVRLIGGLERKVEVLHLLYNTLKERLQGKRVTHASTGFWDTTTSGPVLKPPIARVLDGITKEVVPKNTGLEDIMRTYGGGTLADFAEVLFARRLNEMPNFLLHRSWRLLDSLLVKLGGEGDRMEQIRHFVAKAFLGQVLRGIVHKDLVPGVALLSSFLYAAYTLNKEKQNREGSDLFCVLEAIFSAQKPGEAKGT